MDYLKVAKVVNELCKMKGDHVRSVVENNKLNTVEKNSLIKGFSQVIATDGTMSFITRKPVHWG